MRVFAVIGIAHAFSDRVSLLDLLEESGIQAAVIVPFYPEWERTVLSTYGIAGYSDYYEILPGVFRTPILARSEIAFLSDLETDLRVVQPWR